MLAAPGKRGHELFQDDVQVEAAKERLRLNFGATLLRNWSTDPDVIDVDGTSVKPEEMQPGANYWLQMRPDGG